MALVVNDRVKETSTTTGTGTFDLAGAATGFQTFVAGIGDTNTTYYAIFNQGTAEWEVGLGTVTDAATDTLARTTLISSSTGSAVSFTSGTKDVFCTLPASKAVYLDGSGNPVNGVTFKEGGTNFTGSLKLGDTTTGTLSSAQYNVGIGKLSMGALSSGDYNTTVGGVSQNTISTGIGNSSLGYSALQSIQGGDKNIGLGYQSGNNISSGSGNVVIGNADVPSATADDQLSISDGEDGTVVWITGESTGNVEINEVWNPSLSTTGKAFVMGF